MELVPDGSLDVISSEPSQLWVKGVGNLFTSEFFRLVERKLRDEGLFVTWMMGYNVPGEVWGIGVATLLDAFPYVFAFAPPDFPADVIFVCGKRPLELQRQRWRALAGLEGTAAYVPRRMGLLELHHLVCYALADLFERRGRKREARAALARFMEHHYGGYLEEVRGRLRARPLDR